jgi:hypothetical protein
MKRRGKNVQLSEIFPSSGVSQRPHRELVDVMRDAFRSDTGDRD